MDIQSEKDMVKNSIALKKANLNLVLREMYDKKRSTILDLAKSLNMSIPTVTTCLKEHLDKNLVKISSESLCTGGRKSKVYEFNALSKIALGVKLLKESAEICATDLYGNVLREDVLLKQFKDERGYYEAFAAWIGNFVSSLPYDKKDILGITIALQALVSDDGKSVYYSELLKSSEIRLEKFSSFIDLNVCLMHDLEAAALFESYERRDLKNAIYFVLNKNFGGMLILNSALREKGFPYAIGTIEHMSLDLNGEQCYCGRRGCIETFCSADKLKEKIKPLSFKKFFFLVRSGDEKALRIWDEYLYYLSLAINNVRLIIDVPVLLGGYLCQFLDDEDVFKLSKMANDSYPFKKKEGVKIIKSRYADDAIKLGAALMSIIRYFDA